MKLPKKLPPIQNVVAGTTVNVVLPIGSSYEVVYLGYSGVTAAQLRNIKLELNGRMNSEWVDGERVLSINAHYDRPIDVPAKYDGVLAFHFNREELEEQKHRRFFALDTHASQGIVTASITMDVHPDAVAPVLDAYAVQTTSVAGAPNILTKVRRFIHPVSSIGQFDVTNIPLPRDANIAAIHFYMPDDADGDSVAQVTRAELLIDNVNWHDVDADIAASIQRMAKRKPEVSKSTVIDLITDGDLYHALPLKGNIQDFRLRCQAASVGQCEIVIEYFDKYGATRF